MATLKHLGSKNADYGAAEQYLLFEHDEFTMKPVLDENGRLIPREDYRLSTLNCGGEDFAVACMRSNLRYEKNQRREDVKSHHYIISFDPRDGPDNGLTVDRAQALGEQFCKEHFPGHQALVCTHPDGHNHSGNIHVHIVINSLRIEEVPFLPYMDRPADTKAGCKHRCTDAALRYFKSEVMEKTGHPRLYLYGGRKLMTSEIKDILENMTTAAPEMEDYIGEDGLLLCCLIFTVPAYAQSNEPQPEATPTPVETEAEPETQNPFTPDGTGTVVDNATDEDGKEFYTITTADESVFYLVIDKQKTSENVYFLNAVTVDELLPLAEQGEEPAEEATPEPEPEPTEPVEEVTEPESEPEKTDSPLLSLLLIGAVVLIGGGAGYYFKIYKPKHEAPDLEDDYCEYEDEGPEEITEEPEDDDTPPWDEDTEEQEARQ